MINYDAAKIRNSLKTEDVFELLNDWGGEPTYVNGGIIARTICHNHPGEGSRKLYYYEANCMFKCYTGCEPSVFDIFELYIKVQQEKYHITITLYEAIRFIADTFGISGDIVEDKPAELIDWEYLQNYDRIKEIRLPPPEITLKDYDDSILDKFNYDVRLTPWLDEAISQEVLTQHKIGFYPGGNQITIPHYDVQGRLVGIRGRTLSKEDAEIYGKYRPLRVNGILYNHPLGLNLYNLNNSKNGIKLFKKAIIFEAEKSAMKYASYFGADNDISVACCGSSISAYQIQLLSQAGANEIVIALDRQFQNIGDQEFVKLKNNLVKIYKTYKNIAQISFIFDKNKITSYKAAPIDEGKDKFIYLYKNRIIL